jgi:hypothetical protein
MKESEVTPRAPGRFGFSPRYARDRLSPLFTTVHKGAEFTTTGPLRPVEQKLLQRRSGATMT